MRSDVVDVGGIVDYPCLNFVFIIHYNITGYAGRNSTDDTWHPQDFYIRPEMTGHNLMSGEVCRIASPILHRGV